MKPKYLLTILPLIALLTGCGDDVKISSSEAPQLAGTALTATPMELVIYPNDRPSIPDGKPTFDHNCAACHGVDGQGGGQGVTVKFDETWAHQIKPVDLYRVVTFGGPKHTHPAFNGKLSPRELWNVVVYCRSLGQPALTTKQISELDPIFGSNCAVCHGPKGDGDGPLAHNLEPTPANFQRFDRFFNRTDDVLFDHIANGIRWEGMPNFLGKQDRAKNVKFDEPFIRKLVQYIHTFHVDNLPVLTAQWEAAGASNKPPAASPPTGASPGTGASVTGSAAADSKGGGAATDASAQQSDAGKVGAGAAPSSGAKPIDAGKDGRGTATDDKPETNNNSTSSAGAAGH